MSLDQFAALLGATSQTVEAALTLRSTTGSGPLATPTW